MKVLACFNLLCYQLLKISRSNILYKSFVASIFLHFFFMLLFTFIPKKKVEDHVLEVKILEDSRVISETDRRKIKRTIGKHGKNQQIKKIIKKVMDESPQKSFSPTQQDQKFVESIEQILRRKQINKRGTEYQLSKKASKKWELEKEEFTQKKERNEIAKAITITEEIQWKHAVKRKIIYRPNVEYPSYYRKKGIQGKTRLLVKVDRLGNVINTTVVSSSGYSKLDVIAKKMIRATRFSPVDGVAIGYDEAEIDVYFRLTD